MQLNSIIFPSPIPSYNAFTLQSLIWIPRSRFFSLKTLIEPLKDATYVDSYFKTRSFTESENSIQEKGSRNLLIYFHGNAEDIGLSSDFCQRLAQGLKVNILSVEYPGYGAYLGDSNAQRILEDAEIVFDFLTNEIKIPSDNIFLFGRSIGSGPATYLASNRNPGLLVLMSPYTSIKEVVKDVAGKFASHLVAERFRNIDEIGKVNCPCYFIHGKKDKLIGPSHSTELFAKCKALAGINLAENMTHNEYSLSGDVVKPLRKFFKQIGIFSNEIDDGIKKIQFPSYSLKIPLKNYKKLHSGKMMQWLFSQNKSVSL